MFKWFKIINTDQINRKKVIYLNGMHILVIKIKKKYYAIEDNCPHQNMPINKGKISKENITCPFHNARFCIKNGFIENTLSINNLNIFKLRIIKDSIELRIDFIC